MISSKLESDLRRGFPEKYYNIEFNRLSRLDIDMYVNRLMEFESFNNEGPAGYMQHGNWAVHIQRDIIDFMPIDTDLIESAGVDAYIESCRMIIPKVQKWDYVVGRDQTAHLILEQYENMHAAEKAKDTEGVQKAKEKIGRIFEAYMQQY